MGLAQNLLLICVNVNYLIFSEFAFMKQFWEKGLDGPEEGQLEPLHLTAAA